MRALLKTAHQHGMFPGAVAGWINVHGQSEVAVIGHESTPDSALVTPHTIYDVASLTKSICTATLAHWLVEQGRWSWDDLLTTWLPEYIGEAKNKITLGHLVSFGVPFTLRLSRLKNLSAAEIWDHITAASVTGPLGEHPISSNITSVLLGRAIENATGETLPNLSQRILWHPLGMADTSFSPPLSASIAPSEKDPWRHGDVRGVVHDESAYVLRELFTAGSAGLFSTVPDLLKYCHALLLAGRGEPSPFPLNQETVQSFGKNVFPESTPGSYGWELDAEWMEGAPKHTFGKTGFTGCSVVINLESGRAGVILSNATYPTRPADRSQLNIMRQKFSK
jgi:CubicO group peptidase (beta-lactamase class C family)